ncbi:MAG TPA: hypothetical protein VMV12_05240 [Candidatus Micrarchaeaceae archaeon]|nr:hypothetical protein [Candidatus Micrarchaeaceae archaeon]
MRSLIKLGWLGHRSQPKLMTRVFVIAGVACWLAGVGLIASAPIASADSGGNNNAGDVWVDNVTNPAGPGHEMDPHLACADINLWGNGLADGTGYYTIDGWPPSGSGSGDISNLTGNFATDNAASSGYHQDQAWPGTQSSPSEASWTYNKVAEGDQVISTINVTTLIADAIANGDAPVNGEGYHFKLQFSQDPQKHKTFWVDCVPASPSPSPSSSPSASPSGGTGSGGSSPSPSPSSSPTCSSGDNNGDTDDHGCGSPSPSPSSSPSGSPSSSPSASPSTSPSASPTGGTGAGGSSPSPSPTGGTGAASTSPSPSSSTSPNGSVLAASTTPTTGAGPGILGGSMLVLLGVIFLGGAAAVRRWGYLVRI